MQRRGNLVLLAISIVLALVTSLLIVRELNIASKRQNVSQVPMESVVVVAKSVPQHTKIDASDIQMQQIPSTAAEPGVATDVSQLLGEYTSTNWISGQQVIAGMWETGQQAAFVSNIPAGEVAYTFADSPVVGVDHLIAPGEYIDIQNDNQGKFTTLTHIRVLYVDQMQAGANPNVQGNTGSGTDTITVAVTPNQAQTLTQMLSAGQLHLMLNSEH